MDSLISQKCDWLGVTLCCLSVPFIFLSSAYISSCLPWGWLKTDRSNNTLIKDLHHRTRRKWNESHVEALWKCGLRITVTHYMIGSQIRKGRQRNEMKTNTQRKCGSERARRSEKEWEKPRERELKGECESCWVNFLAHLWCTAHPHTRTITHWPYTSQTLTLQYSIMYEGKPSRAADNLGLLHGFT